MRAFWIVLDSAGIGNAPDAEAFGDKGAIHGRLVMIPENCIFRIWKNWGFITSTR